MHFFNTGINKKYQYNIIFYKWVSMVIEVVRGAVLYIGGRLSEYIWVGELSLVLELLRYAGGGATAAGRPFSDRWGGEEIDWCSRIETL